MKQAKCADDDNALSDPVKCGAQPVPHVSIVLPVHEEAGGLARLFAELVPVLDALAADVEIVAVDDGSRDATPALLRRLAAGDPRIRVVTLDARAGQGPALAAGFAAARGTLVVTLDADGENDPAESPRLRAAGAGYACCFGYRVGRRDGLHRRLGSRLANGLRRLLLGDEIRDAGCGLKVLPASRARHLPAVRNMHLFMANLPALRGASIAQFPVCHRPRLAGRSRYRGLTLLWTGLVDLMRLVGVRVTRTRYERCT